MIEVGPNAKNLLESLLGLVFVLAVLYIMFR